MPEREGLPEKDKEKREIITIHNQKAAGGSPQSNSIFSSPKKKPFQPPRSLSTPPEVEESSVKTLIRQFEAHEIHNSGISAPKQATACQFFTPIRSQRSDTVAHRISPARNDMLDSKRSQIGKLEASDAPTKGLGGGILISESHFLMPKHCIGRQAITDFQIRFEYLDPAIAYEIEKELPSEEALTHGLKSGENGDLMIVKLRPNSEGTYPGAQGNFTIIKEPTNKRPSMLHFIGYTSGTSLKDSTMPGRPIKISSVTKRGIQATGETAVWNDFKTHGEITEQHFQESATKLAIHTSSRRHEFLVRGEDIYRRNGTLANKVNECYVLYPNIYAEDHVRLAHRTRAGSSGGIYFTPEGEIFSVHCGRLPSDKDYPEHIAFYPWTETITTLYQGQLIYETKPKKLSEIQEKNIGNLKGCTFSYPGFPGVFGHVKSIVKKEKGIEFTIQPAGPQGKNPLRFLVPASKIKPIKINNIDYARSELFFNFSDRVEIKVEGSQYPEGLYRLSLKKLEKGEATNEIPSDAQVEIARRINCNEQKHSMTSADKIQFEHVTLGDQQRAGTSYHFVRESDFYISIHAIGSHKTSDSYQISRVSAAFKDCANSQRKWAGSEDKLPTFSLRK